MRFRKGFDDTSVAHAKGLIITKDSVWLKSTDVRHLLLTEFGLDLGVQCNHALSIENTTIRLTCETSVCVFVYHSDTQNISLCYSDRTHRSMTSGHMRKLMPQEIKQNIL